MAMKGGSRRPEQVGETIRQVVTDALLREVRDPRVGFVTVTHVQVTNERSHAKVMVAVPGSEEEKTRALDGLKSAAGFFRSKLAKALTTRVAESHVTSRLASRTNSPWPPMIAPRTPAGPPHSIVCWATETVQL